MPNDTTSSPFPLELTPPDIDRYRTGNGSIAWCHSFEADKPGPHVMVSAIVHGNELCGAIALDWLLTREVRPVRGRLSLCFMNVGAYQRFDPANPTASRFVDEDFNRLWDDATLDSSRDSAELRRAREVRPLVDTVDLLLDIHSMQQPARPLMLAGPLAKGRALAHQVGVPQTIIADAGHEAGRRMRDYRGFADPASARNALLVECGQHWASESATLAIDCALRFLRETGTVAESFGGDRARHAVPAQQTWEVTDVITIRSDHFRFARDWTGGEIIAEPGTLLGHDDQAPVITPFADCMLVMPTRRFIRGQTAVRLARRMDPTS